MPIPEKGASRVVVLLPWSKPGNEQMFDQIGLVFLWAGVKTPGGVEG